MPSSGATPAFWQQTESPVNKNWPKGAWIFPHWSRCKLRSCFREVPLGSVPRQVQLICLLQSIPGTGRISVPQPLIARADGFLRMPYEASKWTVHSSFIPTLQLLGDHAETVFSRMLSLQCQWKFPSPWLSSDLSKLYQRPKKESCSKFVLVTGYVFLGSWLLLSARRAAERQLQWKNKETYWLWNRLRYPKIQFA